MFAEHASPTEAVWRRKRRLEDEGIVILSPL
jgi:hypothetical protein